MCNIRLHAPTLEIMCDIAYWLPCGADERTYGHVTVWIDSQIVGVDGSACARLANAWSSAKN